jgi:hypothetical protein
LIGDWANLGPEGATWADVSDRTVNCGPRIHADNYPSDTEAATFRATSPARSWRLSS